MESEFSGKGRRNSMGKGTELLNNVVLGVSRRQHGSRGHRRWGCTERPYMEAFSLASHRGLGGRMVRNPEITGGWRFEGRQGSSPFVSLRPRSCHMGLQPLPLLFPLLEIPPCPPFLPEEFLRPFQGKCWPF